MRSLHGKVTVILVTSRPSWLRMSDQRYVMTDGDLQLKAIEAAPAQISAPKPDVATAPAPKQKLAAPQPVNEMKAPPAPALEAKPVAAPAAKPQKTGPTISTPPARPAPTAKPIAKPIVKPVTPPAAKKGPTISQPERKAAPIAKPAPKPTPKPAVPQPKPTQEVPAARKVTPRPIENAPKQKTDTPPTHVVRPRQKQVPTTVQQPALETPVLPTPAQVPKPVKTAKAKFKAAPTPAPNKVPKPAQLPSVLKETDSAIDNSAEITRPKPVSKSTARFTPKTKTPPKPLATLRAAPNAGAAIAPKRATAVLKPSPRKPTQSANNRQTAGGAE